MGLRILSTEFNLGVFLLRTSKGPLAFRLLCEDQSDAHFIYLGKWDMNTGKFHISELEQPASLLQSWNSRELVDCFYSRLLVKINDITIPDAMARIWGVQKDKFPEHEKRCEAITFMLTSFGHSVITNRAARATAITDASRKFSMSASSLRTWFFKFIFYGGHPGALLSKAEISTHSLFSLRNLPKSQAVSGRLIHPRKHKPW